MTINALNTLMPAGTPQQNAAPQGAGGFDEVLMTASQKTKELALKTPSPASAEKKAAEQKMMTRRAVNSQSNPHEKQKSLASAAEKLGLNPKTEKKDPNDSLKQKEFMRVFIAQMQNQNPLEPQEGADLISQLAQFTLVENVEKMEQSITGMANAFQSNQSLQASTLVGRQVSVPGDKLQLTEDSHAKGQITVDEVLAQGAVTIYDKANQPVRTLELNEGKPLTRGQHHFVWDGKDKNGNQLPAGHYRAKASGIADNKEVALRTYVPQTVESVSLGHRADGMKLNLSDGSTRSLKDIQEIS